MEDPVHAIQTKFQKDTTRNLTEIHLENKMGRDCQGHFEKKRKMNDDSPYSISKYCINL